jgi:hypothetical protein
MKIRDLNDVCRKMLLLLATILITITTSSIASAQVVPWTAVASTGVIDESDESIYAFSGSALSYLVGSASTSTIEARYNVVNTFDNNANPNIPGWTILELGSSAPAGSTVSATLYRVRPCDGFREILCTVSNVGEGQGGGICKTCQFAPNTINFANYLYFVQVNLSRNTAGVNPNAYTLRLLP